MISTSMGIKKYHSAQDRFLKAVVTDFFKHQLPQLGPVLRENLAGELLAIIRQNCPPVQSLKHGQMLWNALDVNTPAGSPNRRLKPLILTLVDPQDIQLFEKQTSIKEIRQQVMARITNEAHQQGGVLSTRDMSLILVHDGSALSKQRIQWEQKNGKVLPHVGNLHDCGTTLTHKYQIVYKCVVEKKAPNVVAREMKHSQSAVDRYLKDFNRVKTLVNDNKNLEFIHLTTGIARHVIEQYQDIINKYFKELK